MGKRRSFDKNLKAKVALEAIRGERTLSEIASCYEVHPNMVTKWKKQMLENLPDMFEDKRTQASREKDDTQKEDKLYTEIGRLQVENAWLKKKCDEWNL